MQTFNSDSLNQLTTATRTGTATVSGNSTEAATSVTVNGSSATIYNDRSFARESVTLSAGNNSFTAIGTDASGRLSTNSITVNLPATMTFQYDTNGNMVSDGVKGYSYDDENQLISIIKTNDWKSEFIYDGKLRRRITKEYNWNGSSWVAAGETRYVYDGMLPVQERTIHNIPAKSYTRGIDLSGSLQGAGGIGGLLALADTAGTLGSYFADALGNVTAIVDPEQNLAARYDYDPYGNLTAKAGPYADLNNYRFSSKDAHDRSGLVYYGYRFYAPQWQRWVNRDPIGEEGGINLYRINYSNPIAHIDAFGHSVLPVCNSDHSNTPCFDLGKLCREFPWLCTKSFWRKTCLTSCAVTAAACSALCTGLTGGQLICCLAACAAAGQLCEELCQ